jgi:hypothetical protein
MCARGPEAGAELAGWLCENRMILLGSGLAVAPVRHADIGSDTQ